MFTRHYLAVAVVLTGLAVGLPALIADEGEPTAAELYEQGMRLYEGGELEAARDVFHQVDPMQLPKNDRLDYYDAIKSIDEQSAPEVVTEAAETAEAASDPAEPAEDDEATDVAEADLATDDVDEADETTDLAEADVASDVAEEATEEEVPVHPSQLLWQADQAMSDNPSLAASLYQVVLDDERTDEVTAAQAKARLAQANRLAEPALDTAREHLDLATAALEAGRYDNAQAHVQSIQTSGVVLGWRNQARLDRVVNSIN